MYKQKKNVWKDLYKIFDDGNTNFKDLVRNKNIKSLQIEPKINEQTVLAKIFNKKEKT